MRKDLAVIDLGTSNVCATIARYIGGSEKKIKILGVGYRETKGLEYGRITDIGAVENSIFGAISTATNSAQKRIQSAIVSLPPWAVNYQIIEISRDINNTSISNSIIQSFVDECIVENEEIIHIIPIDYTLDNTSGIKNPVGMVGKELSAVFNVLSVRRSILSNLRNIFTKNNIEVPAFVSSSLMSAIASNSSENAKATVIDFGGICIVLSCINDGDVVYSETIPLGSNLITQDIANVLKISSSEAEKLKVLYGLSENTSKGQILVTKINEYGEKNIQSVSPEMLNIIIGARLDEILEAIKKHILENNISEEYYEQVLITGGGSRLNGLSEYIKSSNFLVGASIDIALPTWIIVDDDYVKSASFSASAGALMYGFGLYPNIDYMISGRKSQKKVSLFKKIKSLFSREI